MTLSQELRQKIDRELRKYPPDQKQSAVMSALGFAQDDLTRLRRSRPAYAISGARGSSGRMSR